MKKSPHCVAGSSTHLQLMLATCVKVNCGNLFRRSGLAIKNTFGAGTGPTWLDNVKRNGSENALQDCPRNDWGDENCGHSEDISILCIANLSYAIGKLKRLITPSSSVIVVISNFIVKIRTLGIGNCHTLVTLLLVIAVAAAT